MQCSHVPLSMAEQRVHRLSLLVQEFQLDEELSEAASELLCRQPAVRAVPLRRSQLQGALQLLQGGGVTVPQQ